MEICGKNPNPCGEKSKGRGSINPINGLQRLERALHQTNNRIKMYRGRGVDTLRVSKRDSQPLSNIIPLNAYRVARVILSRR